MASCRPFHDRRPTFDCLAWDGRNWPLRLEGHEKALGKHGRAARVDCETPCLSRSGPRFGQGLSTQWVVTQDLCHHQRLVEALHARNGKSTRLLQCPCDATTAAAPIVITDSSTGKRRRTGDDSIILVYSKNLVNTYHLSLQTISTTFIFVWLRYSCYYSST
jgi:hypothetical protein